MLEAVVQKKLRGHLRSLVKDDQATRAALQQEDLITSAVFGPLQYMPARDAWHAVCHTLLGHVAADVRHLTPLRHCLNFWPSLPLSSRTRVEPDLILEFDFADGPPLVIALEVKWNADLMEDQLSDQKQAVEQAYSGRVLKQVFLAKTLATDRAQEQVEAVACHAVTWGQVATAASRGGSTGIWFRQVQSFLRTIGEATFSGFDDLVCHIDNAGAKFVRGWSPFALAFSRSGSVMAPSAADVFAWKQGEWRFGQSPVSEPITDEAVLAWRIQS